MGEVYRAHDTKLESCGRHQAASGSVRHSTRSALARFEREAQALASLNHPHIAAMYDFEEAAGRHLLVMELVEGDTLADRLARGPMPVDEALTMAHQMLKRSKSAHEKGIFHRDLKPANVKLTPDGMRQGPRLRPRASSWTATTARRDRRELSHTDVSPRSAGMIMGTAGYMSPEQAKGLVADHRSDIFSFGGVLFEMLTGRRAFHGDTPAETMAAFSCGSRTLHSCRRTLNPRLRSAAPVSRQTPQASLAGRGRRADSAIGARRGRPGESTAHCSRSTFGTRAVVAATAVVAAVAAA